MHHLELVVEAKKAINQVNSDLSSDTDEIRESLLELREEIDTLLAERPE